MIALKEAEHRALVQKRFPDWDNRIEYWHIHDIDAAHPDDATKIMAATPITTPSTVRNERVLCSRTVWKAIREFMPKCIEAAVSD